MKTPTKTDWAVILIVGLLLFLGAYEPALDALVEAMAGPPCVPEPDAPMWGC